MKRNYPLFTVDRSKRSAYPFDFITCYDRTVGFVARVVPFFKDAPFNEFLKQMESVDNPVYAFTTHRFKKEGGVVLVIEDFLHYFEVTKENQQKVSSLLKKAIKKYLHAEKNRAPAGGLTIEDQIKAQEQTIEMNRQNFDKLLERVHGDKENAAYILALAEATLETLKYYRDNIGFINLN